VEPLTWLVLQAVLGRYEVLDVLYLYYVEGWRPYRIGRRLGLSGRTVRLMVTRVWEEVDSGLGLADYLRYYYSNLLEVEPLIVLSDDGFTCRLCGDVVLRHPERHVLERHLDLLLAVRDAVRLSRGRG
jgi:hypothetical protein